MKNIALFIAIIIFQSHLFANEPSYPKLFFSYSWLYDSVCAEAPNKQIKPEWAQEAREKSKDFELVWMKEAPALMNKLFEIFNLGFQRKEVTATLSVCPRTQSFSNPLVLNVNRHLKSYMADRPVASETHFADLVFHELLHTWIVENLPWPSPILERYKVEAQVTKNHLHLMAVQKLIYTELKRSDLLSIIKNPEGFNN